MKLSIIIPVFNEKETIEKTLVKIEELPLILEIIIVNDGSTDGTMNKIKNLSFYPVIKNLKIINHVRNQGKGMAIRSGIKYATGDYTIIQDADLEYNPEDILKMVKLVKEKKAEVVYGSRFTGQYHNMSFWHFIGNKFLTFLTNILYGTAISDMETGYKLIRTDILKNMDLKCQRFEFEPEVSVKILKKGIKIHEIPISYTGRDYKEGKKITWRDALPAILTIIKYRFIN